MTDIFDIKIDKDRTLLRVRSTSKLRTALARKFPELVPGDSIPVNQLLHLTNPGRDAQKVAVSVQNFYLYWSRQNNVTFRARVGRDEQAQARVYIVPAKAEVQLELPTG